MIRLRKHRKTNRRPKLVLFRRSNPKRKRAKRPSLRLFNARPKRRRTRRKNWTLSQARKGGIRSARRQRRTPRGRFAGLHSTLQPIRKWRRSNKKRRTNRRRTYRRTNRFLKRSASGRFVRRSNKRRSYRRSNPRRTYRRTNRRLYLRRDNRKYRRSNRRRRWNLGGGGTMALLKKLALPIAVGAGVLALNRIVASKLGTMIADKTGWSSANAQLASSGLILAGTIALLKFWKKGPQELKIAAVVGAGIDVALRLVGKLLETSQPGLAAILQGNYGYNPTTEAEILEARKGWQAIPAPPAAEGFGQYDVYEAGLMGQGGMSGYIRDPGTQLAGLGSYVQSPPQQLPIGNPGGMGSYIQTPGAGQSFNVQQASAGFGAMVQEAPAGFLGGPNF